MIEKLASGNYRIRKMHNGKVYRAIFDHKPTQKEALQAIADLISNDETIVDNMTFNKACTEYLKIKSNVLSPSTKRGYMGIVNALSAWFLKLKIAGITQAHVQKEINDYSLNHSAKSVANMHGFISAVIKEFRPYFTLHTKLPQKQIKDSYVPSEEDIKKIIGMSKGGKHELGIKLAICGLRRSEICALEPQDLDADDILHINKAWVQGEDKKWYLKHLTKTDAGTRTVMLPSEYAKLYRETKPDKNNHVYPYNPNTLYDNLCAYQDALNIPHFKLHACRAFYCSLLHSKGFTDEMIMQMGGWKSDYVMKNVYRHALEEDKRKALKKSADFLADF